MHTLLLIDGNALIHRAYHALPDFKTHAGIPTNAVYGFASMLYKVIEDYHPSHVAVCFDTAAPTFRDEIFKEYRIQRPKTDDELIAQFPYVKEFLESAAITILEKDGLEADDLIGILATNLSKNVGQVLIMTGDRDMLQLVSPKISMITPQIGFAQSKLYNETAVEEKYGIKPTQIVDFKALAGDASDNYKGVPGIGPKGATDLINEFGTLDNLYKNLDKVKNEKLQKLLREHKEEAFLSKKLAQIVTKDHLKINLEKLSFVGYNENLRAFLEKLEFNSLGKRFFPNSKKVQKTEEKKDRKSQLDLF